ncbi:RagB/SusD family nutrient uptake outer membrane protein [Deminuibacter soli]|uniref:RagB/SusD family nutrient uptake outer membrane protein n=1 Tax=Deminuibacter soli TaxID=2291815 RepID=A0A3E1NMJ7_9BACT|nr:RagB/SusD family nutrient uptake outer membrane protein [Deminuibacter soli]RFM29132.1 RagB/SusD family nutrient uptake outer membrane protein [Deminuibacter soli]
MKKILFIALPVMALFAGCKKESEFLDIPPIQVLPSDVTFSDPALVLAVAGDLYNRQLDFSGLDNGWSSFTDFSESFPSENGSYFYVNRTGWDYSQWGVNWSDAYHYIRDLNLFIQRDSASKELTADDKKRFLAEGRFLRANFYFEMAKRMGGVPLILTPLDYDFKGDPSYLQSARAKESDIYDFVISEAEAIKNDLPADVNEKSRATKGAALAMEARAALYAGSIAKYGANTPAVSLPGGEVGIPSSKAADYYQKALKAAQSLINGEAGAYKLYQVLPNLADNFTAIFLDKSSVNQESIFIEDFKVNGGKTHAFTTNDQPYSFSDEGGDAGRLNPSLNFVEAFEKLDNTYAPLPTVDGAGNPIYYDTLQKIFAGRDARLEGTVIIPGSKFKGNTVDIWAGYVLADGSIFTSDNATNQKPLPGTTTPIQVVGNDGPIGGLELRTQSGFYIRKWLDPQVGSGRRGRGSDVAFIRYRFAEVLLNAAEAAFELGDMNTAALYMNQVRARAGLTIPLTTGEITFDRIVHERRVELAFEGHQLYDMKRWRLATAVWDGTPTSKADLLSNIGSATKKSTQPWGLWPYKYYNPGSPNNGKWLYKEVLPSPVTGVNRFQLGNYYSFIGDDVRSANPKIVRQPNQ